MKKYILTLLVSVFGMVSFSQTKLVAPVVRNNSADTTYATHTDTLGIGGMQVFHDTTGRNAIPYALRKRGMVAVVNDSLQYQLQGGIANSNWTLISVSPYQNNNKWSKTGDASLSRDSNFLGSKDTSQVWLKSKGIKAIGIDSSQNVSVGSNAGILPDVSTAYPFGKFTSSYNTVNSPIAAIAGIVSDAHMTRDSTGFFEDFGNVSRQYETVKNGITNSGQVTGYYAESFRNYDQTLASQYHHTGDSGIVYGLYGGRILFGHANTDTFAYPHTYNAYGLFLYPYAQTGLIDNMYDLYLYSKNGSATITNHYGLYQLDGNVKNYLGGTTAFNKQISVADTARFNGTVSIDTGKSIMAGGNRIFNYSPYNANIFWGQYAGNLTGTGFFNSSIGVGTLYQLTTGSYNNTNGAYSQQYTTTGYQNSSSGYASLKYNGGGYNNTAMGVFSLNYAKFGHDNTAIGFKAGLSIQAPKHPPLTIGVTYMIDTVGTVNWTLLGAANNLLGTVFTDTAVGATNVTGWVHTLDSSYNNTFLGSSAGLGIYRGWDNTILGANISFLSNVSKNIALGTGDGVIRALFDSTLWNFYTSNLIRNNSGTLDTFAMLSDVRAGGGGNVTGTGTSGNLVRWNGTHSQNNSILTDDGTNIYQSNGGYANLNGVLLGYPQNSNISSGASAGRLKIIAGAPAPGSPGGQIWLAGGAHSGGYLGDIRFYSGWGVGDSSKLRAVIDSGGRVGINDSLPDSTLTLKGSLDLQITGFGSGKVLTSSATGGASWQTPSGGGGSGISKLGSPAYGLTKTNDSTYILDTTIAASQIRLHNDSTTLATAINTKQNIITVLPIANGGTNNGSLSVTAGTIYYGDGTKLIGLAPGTANQVLHSGTTPVWKDTTAAGGGGAAPGNYGDVPINRNGAYATPGADSMIFNAGAGLSVKGSVTATTSFINANMTMYGYGIVASGSTYGIGIGGLRTISAANTNGVEIGRYNTSTISTYTGANTNQNGTVLYSNVNQSGTSSFTDLQILRTNTTSGSGNQYLVDAQVGGISKIHIDTAGSITTLGTATIGNIPTGVSTDSQLVVHSGQVKEVASSYGTFLPTLTNTTNITSSSADTCTYSQQGNIVTVGFDLNWTPTAVTPTTTVLTFTIPIAVRAGGFPFAYWANGTANCENGALSYAGTISATVSGTTVTLTALSPGSTPVDMKGTFQYRIN